MNSFGTTSSRRLLECEIDIQHLSKTVIRIVDHSIITGHRNEEGQNKLYPKYSKVMWPNSKHNSLPSTAIDVAPYIEPYGTLFGNSADIKKIMQVSGVSEKEANAFILKAYARLIGIYEAIAYTQGISIRVGMDWDGDFNLVDQKFHDLGHVELK